MTLQDVDGLRHDLPTSNIIQRLLWLRCGARSGTGFTIEIDDRQFLVTAAHTLADQSASNPVLLNNGGAWVPVNGDRIPPDPSFVDIAIVAPNSQLTTALPIRLGSDHLVLGQDLLVLGYPFDVDAFDDAAPPPYMSNGSPLPLVKRAGFAWRRKAEGAGHFNMYLDRYLTEGFSGGPVFGFPAMRGSSASDATIVGVVSHYVPETQPVLAREKDTGLVARQNPAIAVALDIQHAIDGIRAHGLESGAPVTVRTL